MTLSWHARKLTCHLSSCWASSTQQDSVPGGLMTARQASSPPCRAWPCRPAELCLLNAPSTVALYPQVPFLVENVYSSCQPALIHSLFFLLCKSLLFALGALLVPFPVQCCFEAVPAAAGLIASLPPWSAPQPCTLAHPCRSLARLVPSLSVPPNSELPSPQ